MNRSSALSPVVSLGLVFLSLMILSPLRAANSTWDASPENGDWNTAANWTPMRVPNGPGASATFSFSDTTDVSVTSKTRVSGIIFASNASPFTIIANAKFAVFENGITNNSPAVQNFVNAVGDRVATTGLTSFRGNATIVGPVTFTNQPALVDRGPSGKTHFRGNSNAGQASFFNYPSTTTSKDGPPGSTVFYDHASAGSATFTNRGNFPDSYFPAYTEFLGSSTADHATFINLGTGMASGGETLFYENSTAADGTFINSDGGTTQFDGLGCSAGNAVITNNGATTAGTTIHGGVTAFYYSSDAGTATLVANGGSNGGNGGQIFFRFDATAPNATIKLYGNGTLNPPSAAGSIEGDGIVLFDGLSSESVAVGSNNKDTTFSGVFEELVDSGQKGFVEKVGTGTFTLTGASTNRGGMAVSSGTLIVDNATGSATGSGPVTVLGGTLGGGGAILGQTTIGTGNGPGATLQPGSGDPGGSVLTFSNLVLFKADGTYLYQLDSTDPGFIALQTSIEDGAQFVAKVNGPFNPPGGTILTAIQNTSTIPISGTFANLPDGGTITVGNNTYKANYEGGDGNDLTLTLQ